MFREFSQYGEFIRYADSIGLQIVEPQGDPENGPSADDLYEPTLVLDRIAGEEVGIWLPSEFDDSDFGIVFDNPNDFVRWWHTEFSQDF